MEPLTETLACNMGLTEGETELVAADPAHAARPTDDQSLSLIGKVITNRDLSMNFIRASVNRLLRPVKKTEIRFIADNMFVMKFNHPLDRQNALKGCPSVLDKTPLSWSRSTPRRTMSTTS